MGRLWGVFTPEENWDEASLDMYLLLFGEYPHNCLAVRRGGRGAFTVCMYVNWLAPPPPATHGGRGSGWGEGMLL